MKHLLTLLVASLLLSGCAGFQQPPLSAEYFGEYPKNLDKVIPEYMSHLLKDPESARYRYGRVQRGYVNNGLIYGGKVVWQGYIVYFTVNAKNSYGGYTGEEPYFALYLDGVISHVDTADHDSSPYILLHKL